VAHFGSREFLCPCCCGGNGKISKILVMWLDILRRAWGEPVIVNSGWRCAAHNMKVGGSRTSRHLIGCAADIRTRPGSIPEWERFSLLARRLYNQPGWEFLPYQTFIHVAVPREESERKWSGGQIKI